LVPERRLMLFDCSDNDLVLYVNKIWNWHWQGVGYFAFEKMSPWKASVLLNVIVVVQLCWISARLCAGRRHEDACREPVLMPLSLSLCLSGGMIEYWWGRWLLNASLMANQWPLCYIVSVLGLPQVFNLDIISLASQNACTHIHTYAFTVDQCFREKWIQYL